MRLAVCVASVVAATSTTAVARPEWADPLRRMEMTCDFFDPNYIRTPCRPPGREDRDRNKWRQHLGTDFRATEDQVVYAPVSGTIDCSRAGRNEGADVARAIIRDGATNEEHVLGHVYCTVESGPVSKGRPVAKVRYLDTGTVLHWGFNVVSVSRALTHRSQCFRDNQMRSCEWGWGKAPYEATRSQAVSLGWRPVL
jgi:murein DD-endopeptidase MepM/ murein hydrolase activator NlpD